MPVPRASEVQARQRRLFLLRDTLERLSIDFLVHELTSVFVPLRPVSVYGVLNLREIPYSTIAVAVTVRGRGMMLDELWK